MIGGSIVIATILGIIFTGESLTFTKIFAIAFIILGSVILASLQK